MLIRVSEAERHAILAAMVAVATADGRLPLTAADAVAIAASDRIVLGAPAALDPHALPPIAPAALAAAVPAPATRAAVGKCLAVLALVDGIIDPARIAAVRRFAAALGLHEQYVRDLSEAARGHLAWVIADLGRQNAISLTHGRVRRAADYPIWPYRARGGDAALVARYAALTHLPSGTLGREFVAWYRDHGFPLPGEPEAVNESFVQPHDATHLLSGYSTSAQGELLVTAFTFGMMGEGEPLGGHILPVLFSFHLGIRLNDLAGAWRGGFDAEKFWTAWDRGAACRVNVFAADWDFWAVAGESLTVLRARYAIPSLPPAMAASDVAELV